jgi:hypothetical protein
LPSANGGTTDGPGFTAVGSVPSVDWLCNRPQEVNTRSCAAFGLVHGALRAKLGCAYRAGRQHGDRAALSSMAACMQDTLSKEVRMYRLGSGEHSESARGMACQLRQLVGKPWEPPASEQSVGIRVRTLGGGQPD